MNISSMRIGRKIIASSGHDQKNIYVIKQVVQKTEKQNEKKVEVPSSSLMKHNNNNNHDTAKSLKLKYARKYGWRERAMKNIMVAKRSGLRRRQAAAVNTVTSRNCAATRLESSKLITRTNAILNEYKQILKKVKKGLQIEEKKINGKNDEVIRATNKYEKLLSMSESNEIQYILSDLKSKYDDQIARHSQNVVEQAKLNLNLKQFEAKNLKNIDDEIDRMIQRAKFKHDAYISKQKEYTKMVMRFSGSSPPKIQQQQQPQQEDNDDDEEGREDEKGNGSTITEKLPYDSRLKRILKRIEYEKRELIATFYQSDLSDLKIKTKQKINDLIKEKNKLEKKIEFIKSEFHENFMKLQEYKGSNQQRRMTSQSIDTFRPQSIHRLSLQKLRLAKPLSEAKQLLDECLYHREVQHSRVKLGCEMIKRLKNGKEVLTRVNKHNHYRLEMAVEYSDKAIFKKVENEDKIIFQPDILPVKKFVVPFGGLRNYK